MVSGSTSITPSDTIDLMVENEIQFLSWQKFRRMGPAIVRLEISRIERLMRATPDDPSLHNALVRARFELREFLDALEQVDRRSLESACAPHLRAAILAVSISGEARAADVAETLNYIGARLHHVHDRMVLLY
jgi:hypothetical protein